MEHGSHPRRIAASQRPGRLLVDITVGFGDDPPYGFEREMKFLIIHMRTYGS